MNEPAFTNRRTVLKTIPATIVGGSVVAGTASATREARSAARDSGTDVEIVAEHDHETDEHLFELSTHEIASGWTTVTLDNRTDHTHIAYLVKLPQAAIDAAADEGTDTLDYYVEHITRPFQWFMDDIDPATEPDPDDLSEKYSDDEELFPDWYDAALPSGGVGLTSSDTVSVTTVDLEPGTYIVECYVKDDDGVFHSYLGMIDRLTVTDDRSGTEPEPTLELSLSTDGIESADRVGPGQHRVAVRIADQRIYDHLLGHDVHLIRFDAETTVADVNDWMNWMDPAQFVSDGSEPGTFLGGVQTIVTSELLEGADSETAYFDVNLNPGAYAWVSEVPDPGENGFLKPFTVPFDRDSE